MTFWLWKNGIFKTKTHFFFIAKRMLWWNLSLLSLFGQEFWLSQINNKNTNKYTNKQKRNPSWVLTYNIKSANVQTSGIQLVDWNLKKLNLEKNPNQVIMCSFRTVSCQNFSPSPLFLKIDLLTLKKWNI